MTTQAPPFQFGTLQGDLGHAYVFAAEAIRQELEDKLDLLSMGVVPLVGDLAGSGSDVVRVTRVGSIGFGRRFTDLTNEDDAIPASSLTTGYDTVTIGMAGLAEEETYSQQILGREKGVTLDQLKALVPASWLATWRYKLGVEASTWSQDVGAAGSNCDRDTFLDLLAEFDETLGSDGVPTLVCKPLSWTRLSQSWAGHAAFQNSVVDFEKWVARNGRQDKGIRLGIRCLTTDDIQESGGAYLNYAFEPGAAGWAVANTSPVRPSNPQGAIYVPGFGLLIEEIASTGERGTRRYEARTWFGIDSLNDALAVKRRFLDKIA